MNPGWELALQSPRSRGKGGAPLEPGPGQKACSCAQAASPTSGAETPQEGCRNDLGGTPFLPRPAEGCQLVGAQATGGGDDAGNIPQGGRLYNTLAGQGSAPDFFLKFGEGISPGGDESRQRGPLHQMGAFFWGGETCFQGHQIWGCPLLANQWMKATGNRNSNTMSPSKGSLDLCRLEV